jgi:pimeloyl-ACP methyl ester carboxylesterase
VKIGHVDVDGAAIRYLETGDGAPLVHLVEPGALRPGPAHALLAARFRVLVLETPLSSAHLVGAMERLELEAVALLATGRAARAAAELALSAPACVRTLALESPAAPDDTALETRLAEVTAPALVLLGARVGGDGRRWADRIPNGYVVYVYDAGHAIATERPEAFAEVVTDFFERREAFVISRATTVIHP